MFKRKTKKNEWEYSLWLMSSGENHKRLQRFMIQIGKRYSTPLFNPHVTLVGKLTGNLSDLIQKTAELSSQIEPLPVDLTEIDYSEEYFKCFFIKVRESKEIIDANKKARQIFEVKNEGIYSPRLSLMYGTFSPEQKRRMFSNNHTKIGEHFLADKLYLFSTHGCPEAWFNATEFNLS